MTFCATWSGVVKPALPSRVRPPLGLLHTTGNDMGAARGCDGGGLTSTEPNVDGSSDCDCIVIVTVCHRPSRRWPRW